MGDIQRPANRPLLTQHGFFFSSLLQSPRPNPLEQISGGKDSLHKWKPIPLADRHKWILLYAYVNITRLREIAKVDDDYMLFSNLPTMVNCSSTEFLVMYIPAYFF